MHFRSPFIPVLAASFAMASSGFAEAEETFAQLAERSLAEINAEKWNEALATLDLIIGRFGKDDPFKTFGPQFGAIYYRKGLCELNLKKWKEAAASFESCYQDFPNPPGGASNGNVNAFQMRALLKWGEASMGAGEWEAALGQFRKFLQERDKVADTYPAGAFHINVAICNYKLGRIPPGTLNLEIAISNKDNFPTPDEGIVAGFEAFVGTAIAGKDEEVILEFIRKNRGGITFEPCDMSVFSAVYMKLAAEAMAADMPATALAVYQLVPSSEAVIDDLRARIAAMGKLAAVPSAGGMLTRKVLEDRLSALENEYRGAGAAEIVKLAAVALIHEKRGNLRGAYAAFGQLVQYFPNAARREEYLFNFIRLGILLEKPESEISEATARLLAEFPNSANAPAARELTLSTLFQAGKYEESLKLAGEIITGLKEGTPGHDLCLHVLGAASYYTGQYAKARSWLDQHVAKYPASRFAQGALYFQASNLAKLREWDEAVVKLDAFIAKFPDPAANLFLPFALYDRASSHFADSENDPAMADLARLEKEFPEGRLAERALGLQGDVLRAMDKPDEAKKSYIKALDLATARKNRAVADEVLSDLVSLLADKAPKESAAFADRFWKEHDPKSSFDARVAIVQIKPMQGLKRGDEALGRLREVIAGLSKQEKDYTLEQCVAAYASAYLAGHDADALQKHFETFPGIDPKDQATRALFRMAVINAYEDAAKVAKDEAAALAIRTKILALFQELKSSLSPKELPTPILLKLADHLRSNTSAPREALPFYEEAMSRKEEAFRFASLFGRADTYSRSNAPEELQKGIDDFEAIFKQSKGRVEREYALFRLVETQVSKGDFPKAIENARAYQDPALRFFKYRLEVSLLTAKALQETGDVDGAIAAYSAVWSGGDAPVRFGALALKAWMQLLWNRNKPDDRKIAYQSGQRYLEATRALVPSMPPEELSLWKEIEALVRSATPDPAAAQ